LLRQILPLGDIQYWNNLTLIKQEIALLGLILYLLYQSEVSFQFGSEDMNCTPFVREV
jgi:hypothetical protein